MPQKTWVIGEEVLATDFNTYVQKQVVATFTNAAARDAAISGPTEGMACYLTDVHAFQIHEGTKWIEPGKQTAQTLTAQTNIGAVVTIGGSGFTVPSQRRRYQVAILVQLFKGTAAGAVTLTPTGAGFAGQVPLVFNMTTPEGRSVYCAWTFDGSPATGTGAIQITPSAGTVNVDANGKLFITDVGSI